MKDLRQTGRTTRMIEDANNRARQGVKVCVVMASQRDADRLRGKTHPNVRVIALPVDWIDWRTLMVAGEEFSETLLIDHRVIEQQFAKQLEMLHRFDGVERSSAYPYP